MKKQALRVRSACQLQSFRGKNAGTEPAGAAEYYSSLGIMLKTKDYI